MPALSAFADILDAAADLLIHAVLRPMSCVNAACQAQAAHENELLTRTRDQVVKKFGPNDDLPGCRDIFSGAVLPATAPSFVGGKEG